KRFTKEVRMARKKRTRYSEAQRRQILEAAVRGRLTAADVKKQYGVTPVTYYSWRKKYGVGNKQGGGARVPRVAAAALSLNGGAITQQVRSAVQSKVRALVQDVVRAEVDSYLASLFGGGGGVRRRRVRRRRRR